MIRRTEAVYIRWENGAGEEMGGREGKKERWRFLIYLLLPATAWINQLRVNHTNPSFS
jgi:hypothetical protein